MVCMICGTGTKISKRKKYEPKFGPIEGRGKLKKRTSKIVSTFYPPRGKNIIPKRGGDMIFDVI